MTAPRLLHVASTDVSLELLLGPQLRAFRAAGYEVHTASAPGAFAARLTADGIAHHPLHHVTRSFAPGRDLGAAAELYRLFRRLRPAIVHTHNPKPGVYGRIAGRAAGVPLVVNTQHGIYAQPGDRAGRRLPVYALERLAAACSHIELVQSSEDIATLARLGVRPAKLRLLGNGVDLGRFRIRPPSVRREVRSELGVDEGQVVVGAVGRLVWEKGYGELFAAARRLLARRQDVVFVVAGPADPDKRDGLSDADVGAAEAAGVRFLGMRHDPERLYSAFDMFVLASHREGFPRAAMEAAASGLPVVATDTRGCRQAVANEQTGLLVPVGDAVALERAVERLADDGDLRRQLGVAAATMARVEFDQRRVIARTLEAYAELGRARPARVSSRPGGGAQEDRAHVCRPDGLRRSA